MLFSQSDIISSAIFILLQIAGNLAQTANENVDRAPHERPISPDNSATPAPDNGNNFPIAAAQSAAADPGYPPALPSDPTFDKHAVYVPYYDHPSMPTDLRPDQLFYHPKHPPHYYVKSYLPPPSAAMFPQKEPMNMHVPHRPESKRSSETSYSVNYNNYPESSSVSMKHFAPSAGYRRHQVESGVQFGPSMTPAAAAAAAAVNGFEPYPSPDHYQSSPAQQHFHHPNRQQSTLTHEQSSSQPSSSPQADSASSTSSESSPSIVSSTGAGASLDSLPPQVKEFMEMIPQILSSHENGPVSRFARYVSHSPLMQHVPLLRSALPRVPLAHRARRQHYYYY